MIILIGPSASGKTVTCHYLEENFGIKKVVTHTTRLKRVGEVDGVDYHFVTKEEFDKMKERDEFIETVSYNGNNYGTSKKEVKNDKCMTVELAGARTYASFKDPNIVLFYMNLDEQTCRERMLSRGDPIEKVEERIRNDKDSFHLTDDDKKMIDVYVDTKNHDLASVARFIFDKYVQILKDRGISFTAKNI